MKSEVYNMDCLEYMRTLPDKAFAIAIADPPYGGAGNEKLDGGGGSVNASTGTRKTSAPAGGGADITLSDSAKRTGITRTGGTWATKYAKKLLSGTRHQMRSFSKNFSVFHAIKSSGARITFQTCHRQDVLLFGANYQSARTFQWPWRSMHGLLLEQMQKSLNVLHKATKKTCASTQHKSL